MLPYVIKYFLKWNSKEHSIDVFIGSFNGFRGERSLGNFIAFLLIETINFKDNTVVQQVMDNDKLLNLLNAYKDSLASRVPIADFSRANATRHIGTILHKLATFFKTDNEAIKAKLKEALNRIVPTLFDAITELRDYANAQSKSNALWGLATLMPCIPSLAETIKPDIIAKMFSSLVNDSKVIAQHKANGLWALAKLMPYIPSLAETIRPDIIAKMFFSLVNDSEAIAQHKANGLWALAKLMPYYIPSLADEFQSDDCRGAIGALFHTLAENPWTVAQDKANALWALATLVRYIPFLSKTSETIGPGSIAKMFRGLVEDPKATTQGKTNALWAISILQEHNDQLLQKIDRDMVVKVFHELAQDLHANGHKKASVLEALASLPSIFDSLKDSVRAQIVTWATALPSLETALTDMESILAQLNGIMHLMFHGAPWRPDPGFEGEIFGFFGEAEKENGVVSKLAPTQYSLYCQLRTFFTEAFPSNSRLLFKFDPRQLGPRPKSSWTHQSFNALLQKESYEDEVVTVAGFVIDTVLNKRILNKRIAIEILGPFHYNSKEELLPAQKLRFAILERLGYLVVPLSYTQIMTVNNIRQSAERPKGMRDIMMATAWARYGGTFADLLEMEDYLNTAFGLDSATLSPTLLEAKRAETAKATEAAAATTETPPSLAPPGGGASEVLGKRKAAGTDSAAATETPQGGKRRQVLLPPKQRWKERGEESPSKRAQLCPIQQGGTPMWAPGNEEVAEAAKLAQAVIAAAGCPHPSPNGSRVSDEQESPQEPPKRAESRM
jgi:hypothetical protein